MKIYKSNDLNAIINDLKSGKLLIIPTDTIYGFSCTISSLTAKKRIFYIKKRDKNKPLLILVSSIRMMKKLVFVNKKIKKLVKTTSLITIICYEKCFFNQKRNKNKTLAIRVVKWKWLKKIIKKTGPIYSTSVNINNKSHAVSIEEIKQFSVDGYVNYVYSFNNEPSKIYDTILNKYIR